MKLQHQLERMIERFVPKDPWVKSTFDFVSKNATTIVETIEKPSLMRTLTLGAKLYSFCFNNEDDRASAFFNTWSGVYNDSISAMLFDCLEKRGMQIQVIAHSHSKIRLLTYKDIEFGIIMSTQDEAQSRLFFRSDKSEEEVLKILVELFWELQPSRIIEFYSKVKGMPWDSEHSYFVRKIENNGVFGSDCAKNVCNIITTALDKNIKRSYLFYGPPGTGKSTICNYVINNLGLRAVKIKFSDVGLDPNFSLFIEACKPDVILIDDVDRSNPKSLIEFLENMRKFTKVILGTANDTRKIDLACLRPGRFDEMMEINKLDDTVVYNILGEKYSSFFEDVKNWPVAFTQEFVHRCELQPAAEALESLKSLRFRAENIQKQYGATSSEGDLESSNFEASEDQAF